MYKKNMRYVFNIDPVPKARPKFSSVGGFARAYTSKNTRDFEASVKVIAHSLHQSFPLSDPLNVKIQFFLARPKTVKRVYPSVKFDLDNLIKSFLDACNDVIWTDDSIICDLVATKRYSSTGQGYIILELEKL